jgi:putative phage-type endonuclease
MTGPEWLGTARPIGTYEPGTPAWDAARAGRVGGSEVAAVLGLSPWESPFSLWWRKRGCIPPATDNDLMWWGRALEPVIADRFALEHPDLDVQRCGTYVHRDRDYQLISPDRIAFDGGGGWHLVEIKTAFEGEQWGDPDTEDVPVYYRCQVMWSMDVFGADHCYLVVYFGGGRYREYLIRYDPVDAAILRKRAEEFIDSICQDQAPEIDSHPATYEAIREMHPDIDDTDIVLPADLADPYLTARALKASVEQECAVTTARIADYMGSARRALYTPDEDTPPRAIATRVAKKGGTPYLRANPLPQPKKEIA